MLFRTAGRVYDLPRGEVGKRFIRSLSDIIDKRITGDVPPEREYLFVRLALQRDKRIVKVKDINRLLKRRMDSFEQGKFQELLDEALRCERQFSNGPSKRKDNTDNHDGDFLRFACMMRQGKTREATCFLTRRFSEGGVLDMNAEAVGKKGEPLGCTWLDVLKEKHPDQQPVSPEIFPSPDEPIPDLVGTEITAQHVEEAARRLHGAAGPSGVSATEFSRWLLNYGNASAKIREFYAASINRLVNEAIPWDDLRAFLSGRGLGLDKLPGLRPLTIGNIDYRLATKVPLMVCGEDVEVLLGSDNLCGGLKAGLEGGFHAILLVVKPEFVGQAQELFADLQIPVVSSGKHLGGCAGDEGEMLDFVKKVARWVKCVEFLAEAARKYPHEAYTSFTKSLQCEWRFLQRLIPGSSPCFKELDDVIARVFIPALVGRRVSNLQKRLFALPIRFAGLGIGVPSKQAQTAYDLSVASTSMVREAIQEGRRLDVPGHRAFFGVKQREHRAAAESEHKAELEAVLEAVLLELEPDRRMRIQAQIDSK
ncbi:unnamed protein product, partial [Heterosigma akashiwo]